jgi:hypothetical protein
MSAGQAEWPQLSHLRHRPAWNAAANFNDWSGDAATRHVSGAERRLWADYAGSDETDCARTLDFPELTHLYRTSQTQSPARVKNPMDTLAHFLKLRLNKVKHDVGRTMMGSSDDGLETRQHEVQRLIGLCLLRLQAYERLMKAIVAKQDIQGSVLSLEKAPEGRATAIGRKTLGALINQLIESFLTTDEKGRLAATQPEPFENEPLFGYRMQLRLSDDDFARTENGLRELVLLRNGLVHHFLEMHDLGTLDGCSKAEASLIEASGQIKLHFDHLSQWADDLDRLSFQVAEVIQSDAFRDLVVNGNIPWPSTEIVSALREAAAELALDGWAPVTEASEWVALRYPGELPSNYGCRTWQQVLHQSGIFELRYFQTEGQRRAWYRVRSHARDSSWTLGPEQ